MERGGDGECTVGVVAVAVGLLNVWRLLFIVVFDFVVAVVIVVIVAVFVVLVGVNRSRECECDAMYRVFCSFC